MNHDTSPASFIQLESTKRILIDYSVLETKYNNEWESHTKYKTGQQYKLSDDKPLSILKLIVDSVIDECKFGITDPNKKIVLENHRNLLHLIVKNLEDSEINLDYKKLLCIIDGVIYANTRQLYKKEC